MEFPFQNSIFVVFITVKKTESSQESNHRQKYVLFHTYVDVILFRIMKSTFYIYDFCFMIALVSSVHVLLDVSIWKARFPSNQSETVNGNASLAETVFSCLMCLISWELYNIKLVWAFKQLDHLIIAIHLIVYMFLRFLSSFRILQILVNINTFVIPLILIYRL